LDFTLLTKERYDLIIPRPIWDQPSIQALARWLSADEAKTAILELGGYDITETGRIEWIE
jgi:putative molybdopterin biosynthesis protein